jgi:drug/metabolite transporter (DMT)-like permease
MHLGKHHQDRTHRSPLIGALTRVAPIVFRRCFPVSSCPDLFLGKPMTWNRIAGLVAAVAGVALISL